VLLLKDPSALILFFATGKSSTQDIDTNRKKKWSKNGFGLFLLTLLAKRFALQTQRSDNGGLLPPLDVSAV
jgi:hypothetical protein